MQRNSTLWLPHKFFKKENVIDGNFFLTDLLSTTIPFRLFAIDEEEIDVVSE